MARIAWGVEQGTVFQAMADFENRSWSSRDGLRLHFRDFPGRTTSRQCSACRG
jgi:hypothetical protein